jgi:hypothetical protein
MTGRVVQKQRLLGVEPVVLIIGVGQGKVLCKALKDLSANVKVWSFEDGRTW